MDDDPVPKRRLKKISLAIALFFASPFDDMLYVGAFMLYKFVTQ